MWNQIKQDAIKRLEAILQSGTVSDLSGFELRYSKPYAALIVSTMKTAYEYAKHGAADELRVPSPSTNRSTQALINQNAQAVVEKQMSDLLFQIKAAVVSEVRKTGVANVNVAEVLKTVSQSFDDFKANQVQLGGSVAVAMAVNRGRDDVFTSAKDDIAVYQYSAILDSHVCPICRGLDGSVVDYAGYLATKWKPPIHFLCRCVWVAVLKDQVEIPGVSGMPDAPGGVAAPSL